MGIVLAGVGGALRLALPVEVGDGGEVENFGVGSSGDGVASAEVGSGLEPVTEGRGRSDELGAAVGDPAVDAPAAG